MKFLPDEGMCMCHCHGFFGSLRVGLVPRSTGHREIRKDKHKMSAKGLISNFAPRFKQLQTVAKDGGPGCTRPVKFNRVNIEASYTKDILKKQT